jgi:ribose 5-phosphate isomerase B
MALICKRVAVGCDHAAVVQKNMVRDFLKDLGMEVVDCGCHDGERVDYPDYAAAVCRLVGSKEVELGVVLCGTGIGVSIAANKIHGIRCALCHDHYTAVMAREHNDANVLAMGARVSGPEVIKEMVRTFFTTAAQGAQHAIRREKIMQLELH